MRKSPLKLTFLQGFTLLELLVAMGVLALLLAIIAQLVNSAMQVTTQSGKKMDSDAEARMVFDRMAIDFSNMVTRPDVDAIFYKAEKNDKMFFLSHAPGYYDSSVAGTTKSRISLVGYRVNESDYSLERLGKGLTWQGVPGGADPGGYVFTTGTSNPKNTLSDTWDDIGSSAPFLGNSDFYHVLADLVFRMEVCFQVKSADSLTAAYSNYPVALGATISSGPPSGGKVGDRWYDTSNNRAYRCTSGTGSSAVWQPNGLRDVLGIVVTLAILDNTSRNIASDLTSLAASLSDPDEASDLNASVPRLPAQIWKSALETATKNNSAGPTAAVSQVRIYQRHFAINGNNSP